MEGKKEDLCASGFIIRKNKFGESELLLIQRSKTDPGWPLHWEVPRGHLKSGESVEDGLKREVKEETGLDVKIIKKINIIKYVSDDKIAIIHNFLCTPINPTQEVKLSFEHQNFYWVKSMGELEMMISPELKRAAAQVFNKDSQMNNYEKEKIDLIEEEYIPRIYKEILK